VVVLIERNELVELLRSRGNDHTAEQAEQFLPQHINLHRDRESLRQCGVDPNVLAFILRRQERTTDSTETLLQPAVEDDDGGARSVKVVDGPRAVGARQGASESRNRTALEQTNNVGQVSLQSPPGSGQQGDQTTTRITAAAKNAGFSVTPRPAVRCPRCQFAFGSTDLMLDHLKADHLDADGFTHTSLDIVGVTHRSPGSDLTDARQSDAVLTDLEGADPEESELRAPRRVVIAVILAYVLLVLIVAVLT
jgi:hypothetical protein